MDNDYQLWVGDLTVQPMPCPCCGSASAVWQYIDKPGDPVQRVVMCDGPEYEDERLGLMLDKCPLYMPPNAMYRPTAREAVAIWNCYGSMIVATRMKNALTS